MSEKTESKTMPEADIEAMSKSQKEIYEECMKDAECKKKVIDAYAKGQQSKARETEALANDRVSMSAMDRRAKYGTTILKWVGVVFVLFVIGVSVYFIYQLITQGMSYFEELFGSFA